MHMHKLKIIDSKYYTITNRSQLDITPIDDARNISKLFSILNNNVFMIDNKYVVLEGNPQITNYYEIERKNCSNRNKINTISKSSAKETDKISLLWDKQYESLYWDSLYSPRKDTRADNIKIQILESNTSELCAQIKKELKNKTLVIKDCASDSRYAKLTEYDNVSCGNFYFALTSHIFSQTIQPKLLQWALLENTIGVEYAYTAVVNITDGLDLVFCLVGDTNQPIKISIDELLNILNFEYDFNIQIKKDINYDIWLNVDSDLTPSNKNFWQNVIDLEGNQKNDLFKQFLLKPEDEKSASIEDRAIELITPKYVIEHAMNYQSKQDLIKNYPKIIKYLEQFV